MLRGQETIRFGLYSANLHSAELKKGQDTIRLQNLPFRVLTLLLREPGRVFTREELRQELWPADTFVDFERGISTAVRKLREALGDSATNPRFIETVGRRGYRFIAPVSLPSAELAGPGPSTPQSEFIQSEIQERVRVGPITQSEEAAGSDVGTGVVIAPDISRKAAKGANRRWHAGGALILLASGMVIAAFVGLKLRFQEARPTLPGPIGSIAVLPLENLSGDAAQEYFADGMTDEIITDLAKLAGPKVISRTSAMQYKGTHKKVPEIARELNVDAVVEGSVERSGDRVRVRVQLIQGSTDGHLWVEEYDRRLNDVFELKADLAQDIARQIQLRLTPQQQQHFARNRPTNPQAFQDYLLGRHYWALRTKESLAKAVEYFNRAIQEDPNDAGSYAGLAHTYIVLPMITTTPYSEANPRARQAAEKAIRLDDSLAEAHLAAAEILLYQDWDFAAAEREFKKTLELNPNYATGHQWYGEYLSIMGRHEEAVRELATTLELDPLSAIAHHQAGQTFQQARQYDKAISEYRKALSLNPALYVTYDSLYWALRREGKFSEASQVLQGALPYWKPSERMELLIEPLPRAYAQGGREGFLRESIKFHEHCRDAEYFLALDYADLGDKERALQQLSRAYETHSIILWIRDNPEFDPLRSDPRFQGLVRKIGLPQ